MIETGPVFENVAKRGHNTQKWDKLFLNETFIWPL